MRTNSPRKDIDIKEFLRLLEAEKARLSAALHRHGSAKSSSKDSESDEGAAEAMGQGALLADMGRSEIANENVEDMLNEIDLAISRVADGSYGICKITGAPIPVARLRAIPWTTMTVEAAEREHR